MPPEIEPWGVAAKAVLPDGFFLNEAAFRNSYFFQFSFIQKSRILVQMLCRMVTPKSGKKVAAEIALKNGIEKPPNPVKSRVWRFMRFGAGT